MADQNENTNPQRRRMSLVEMFTPRSSVATSPPSAAVPTTPEGSQHKRGVSISTLGLANTSNGQPSAYNAFARQRRASISTSSASSSPEFRNSFGDEPAVLEEDDTMTRSNQGSPPSPSFARRVSFGAQALRDVRQSGTGTSNGGRRPSSSLYTLSEDGRQQPFHTRASSRSSETVKTGGEGFNWSESLRDRTKRSPSFSSSNPFGTGMNRNKSMGPSTTVEPPKEIPKVASPPPKMKKPDHIGERMLRGDFMMD